MKRFLVYTLLVALPACTPRVVVPPPPVGESAPLREQEARIQTMRAQFSATLITPGSRRRAQGVLLVRKPDQFRLRLWSAFGMSVMDYLSSGGHTRLDLPMSQKLLFDGEVDANVAFHAGDLRAAFLRGDDAYPPPCRESGAADSYQVQCGSRLIHLRNGDLAAESDADDQGIRLMTTYSDMRDFEGARLPFAITMEYPRDKVKLEVIVGRYEVNPPLGDDLFQAEGWPR